MGRGKKKKTKHVPVISREQNDLADSFVNDFLKTGQHDNIIDRITDPVVAGAFIERLPLNNRFPVSLIIALKDKFNDKFLDKTVKRTLFKLKNLGLIDSEVLDTGKSAAIIRPVKKEDPVAYVGNIDFDGSRSVFLMLHKSPHGVDVGTGIISDTYGFQEFTFGNVSKKIAGQIKDKIAEMTGPLTETSISHVATLLEETRIQHFKMGMEGGDSFDYYMQLRPLLLEDASILKDPVVYDFVSPSGSLLDLDIEKLFNHDLMASWQIDPIDIEPLVDEIESIDESPLVLADFQKKERKRNIIQRYINDFFSPEDINRLKRRLEETAYIFYKQGEEDMARIALDVAVSLDQESSELTVNRVLGFIVERSIVFYYETKLDDETEDDDFMLY